VTVPNGTRTTALILGVLLIVIGGGMVVGGYNEMQTDDGSVVQGGYCGSTTGDPAEIECTSTDTSGGQSKFFVGIVLVILGGLGARYGAE
jgi:hypothetical protein